MVLMQAGQSVVSVMESEDAPGTFTIGLTSSLLAANGNALDPETPDELEIIEATYGNATVELMATDADDLWTTQEFVVRRNRKPVAPDDDGTLHVGNIVGVGDGSPFNEAKVTVGSIITDDDDVFSFDVSIDDDEIASHSDEGDISVTVTGLMAGTTSLRLKAIDTGGLRSVLHTISVIVDAGPVATDVPLDSAESTLSRDAQTSPSYATPKILDAYITHTDIVNNNEELTFSVKVDNETIATVMGDEHEDGEGPLTLTLKALGSTLVTITGTEDPNAQNTLAQAVSRSFTLSVVP
jgi:hypothetical protein